MRQAKKDEIKKETKLIGDIWDVMREAVDTHLNRKLTWSELMEVSSKLNAVVESCDDDTLKKLAESMATAVMQHFCKKSNSGDHEDEVRIINETFGIIKKGYWVQCDEASAKDWATLINLAKAIPSNLPSVSNMVGQEKPAYYENRCEGLAVGIGVATLSYLESISKARVA